MLAATSKFLRQIVPPVIATLIAAVLIAGFNSAFQTHLVQPRMAALHPEATTSEPAPARAAPAAPIIAADPVTAPVVERQGDKGGMREASKDHPTLKLARGGPNAGPGSAPDRARRRKCDPNRAPRSRMWRPSPLAPPPVIAAPVAGAAPLVVAAPVARQEPPVVMAAPPMVTVPDRPRPAAAGAARRARRPRRRARSAQSSNTLKPSSLFARAREFGEKIEAAGNEILPNIRQ